MDEQHNAEPWRQVNGSVVCDTPVPEIIGSDDVEDYGGHLIAESIAPRNARRIVACVNACAGIPVQVLEAQASGGLPWHVADQIEQRVLLRDLLGVLKTCHGNIMSLGHTNALDSVPMPFRVWAQVVQDAVAKAERGLA